MMLGALLRTRLHVGAPADATRAPLSSCFDGLHPTTAIVATAALVVHRQIALGSRHFESELIHAM